MGIYILLFRGINVGGKHRLPMKELKSLLLSEGYGDVKTYIQSGNVVLRAESDPSKKIAAAVESTFGFKPATLAIERTHFEKAIEMNPYSSFEGKIVHFYFCTETPNLNRKKLDALAANGEEYELNDSVFYLHAPNGIGRSKLVAKIELCLGVRATGRNLNTVLKLQGMAQDM